MGYFSLLKGVLILSIVTFIGGYIWHAEHVKAEFAGFTARQEEQANAQRLRIIDKIKQDKKKKVDTDVKNAATIAGLRADNKRVRDKRASASFLPTPSTSAKRPDEATINRPEFERAIRKFDEGVQGLVDEGDETRIDLNSAKSWAKE